MLMSSNDFQSTIEEWRIVFWIVFIVAIFRVGVFLIWASGSVQSWNNPKKRVSFESEKLTEDISSNTKEEIALN